MIYLLSKIIIEKNAQSISMAKILGYTNGEISGCTLCPRLSCRAVHLDQPAIGAGNHADSVPGNDADKHYRLDYILHRSEGFRGNVCDRRGGICVVAAIEYRRIRKVPMDEALKNVE